MGSEIVVEEIFLQPPQRGYNSVRVKVRNPSGILRTCLVNILVSGGFWFRDKTFCFRFDLAPYACEELPLGYHCFSFAQCKVNVFVSTLGRAAKAEQMPDGEPVGPSGVTFVRAGRGPLQVYAEQGTYAQAKIQDVLEQRSRAIERVCSWLHVSPRPTTLVLYEKADVKVFDTGHLGQGWAKGALAVEVFNEDTRLEPYHEIVHVQAEVIGYPPAALREGLAVYVEEQMGGHALRFFCPYETIDEAERALAPQFWPLETLLGFTEIGSRGTNPSLAYPQAASFVKHLVARYGKGKFFEAYGKLVNGNTPEAAETNGRTFALIFGKSVDRVEKEWLNSLV